MARDQGQPRHRQEEGAYAALFLLLLTVFIMAGALAVDMGSLYFARNATQSVADMSATAGGLALEPTTNGSPRDGCQAAWEYALLNLPDADPASPSPCAPMPAGNVACSPSTTPISVTGTVGTSTTDSYAITITWPVADGSGLMDARLTPEIDGTQCQRIGVSIGRDTRMLLAGFAGMDRYTVGSASVVRAQASQSQGDLVALVVLDRTNCRALRNTGQGAAIVDFATINVDGQNVNVPGAITVDSDGTVDCPSGNRYTIEASGQGQIIAQATPEGSPGVILSHAMLTNPARAVDPAACGPNGSSSPVQPCPVGGNRITRAPIDHRYNCKSDYGALDIAGCPDAGNQDPHIDQLVARLGGTSAAPAPTGFQIYPRPGEPGDTCQLNSSTNIITLPAGNWYVNCPNTGGSGNTPGFRMTNGGARFTIPGPSEVVFAGGVDVSDGIFSIGSSGSQSIMYVRNHPNANGDGDLEKGAQGQLVLTEVFVYLQRGVLDVGAGSPPLTWIAPDNDSFPFDDLALWSESSRQHDLGGQGNLNVEGTFFTPNAAPFRFTGQGTQSQARAQFVTWRLEFSGQAGLRMVPDPERVTLIPIQGVTLIR